MNRQTFEHLTQKNKKTRYEISKEIKYKENREFVNWLIENNLSQFVNPKYLKK